VGYNAVMAITNGLNGEQQLAMALKTLGLKEENAALMLNTAHTDTNSVAEIRNNLSREL